jgi:hypothetical protein
MGWCLVVGEPVPFLPGIARAGAAWLTHPLLLSAPDCTDPRISQETS